MKTTTTMSDIEGFMAAKAVAVIGLSRDPAAFSSLAWKQLDQPSRKLYAVTPSATEIRGIPCFPNVASLPEKVEAAVFFTPPAVTMAVLPEALAAGVRRVWLQQGTESPEALALCAEKGIAVVSGQCVMMHAQPVAGVHKFHRNIKKLFGGLPK